MPLIANSGYNCSMNRHSSIRTKRRKFGPIPTLIGAVTIYTPVIVTVGYEWHGGGKERDMKVIIIAFDSN